jgi:hypothetical protein
MGPHETRGTSMAFRQTGGYLDAAVDFQIAACQQTEHDSARVGAIDRPCAPQRVMVEPRPHATTREPRSIFFR